MRRSGLPTIFIGSSTQGLAIARAVGKGLASVAQIVLWDTAFDAGTWLLGGILNRAQQSDFAIFVIREDDTARIRDTRYTTVRDNVLFEAGIFMGAIGPERTTLLWPSQHKRPELRLPSDLAGLLRETYVPSRTAVPDLRDPLRSIKRRIVTMGPAVRSGYNEIAALRQTLHEQDIEFSDGSVESVRVIVARAAKLRKRPWFSATSVETLTSAMQQFYDDNVIDDVFWWLIVKGVVTFDNLDYWNDGGWWWEDSLDYTIFTERGVVLLNDLRTDPSSDSE